MSRLEVVSQAPEVMEVSTGIRGVQGIPGEQGVQGNPGATGATGPAAPTAVPSWAQATTRTKPYDARSGAYNFTSANMRKWRAALAKAANGSLAHVLWIGDSGAIGYNGSTQVDSTSTPRRAIATIAAELGVAQGGSGIQTCSVSFGALSDRWTSTGPLNLGLWAGMISMGAGSTVTYTSQVPGTGVDLFFGDVSAAFTYQVDGGSAIPVPTAAGLNGVRKISVTGLANTIHTVKVNAATNYVYPIGASTTATSGVVMHNLAHGGARAASGNVVQNWADATSVGIKAIKKGAFDTLGVTPDLVVIGLGANDIYVGDSPATALAGITAIRNWYPTANVVLTQSAEISGTNQTNWNAYRDGKYQLAETLDCPLIDWSDRLGPYAEFFAAGVLGPDSIHAIHGQASEFGRQFGRLLTS